MAKRSQKKKKSLEAKARQVPVAEPKEMLPRKEILCHESPFWSWKIIVQALVIAAAVLWIYWPALHGDWLYDDDIDITENTITQSPTGLWSIWFEPGSQADFYPIKASVQWLQWHLWGRDTLGYHLTNVILHILSALLVWRLLSKFGLRLAWLGGLIFAIHPVQVESVAWIVELKNTLSLPPFLLAICAWIDYEEWRKNRDYFLVLGLYLVALLCKLSVVLFPLMILLYAWWRRDRICWNDLKISLPFFGVALLLGLVTIGSGIWDHRFNHTESGAMPVGGFLARLVAAGLSFSFCFSKAFLPVGLLPTYPKWGIDLSSPLQWLPLLVSSGVVYWLWTKRHGWGRHALLGLGFFLLTLAPCPGFIPAPDMAFTWVMDHFLYLPIIGLIGLAVAAIGEMGKQLPASFRPYGIGLMTLVLMLLAFGSRSYAKIFINEETLWTYELQHNPEAYLAHNNLGFALYQKGHLSEAMEQCEQALRIKPDDAEAFINLGNTLLRMGRGPEAIEQFNQALRIKPDVKAYYDLGGALLQTGQAKEAIEQYEQALQIKPDYAEAHSNLGSALFLTGRVPEAIEQYEQALRIKPEYVDAHLNLGYALQQTGRLSEAIKQYEEGLRLNPDLTAARDNLTKLQALQKASPPKN